MSWIVGIACTRLVEGGRCSRRLWASPPAGASPAAAVERAQQSAVNSGWAITRDGVGDLCPRHNPDAR